MKKPFICNCGIKNGKHKRDHWCDVFASTGYEDASLEPWDEVERLLDERSRARYVNELNKGAAK